MSIKDACNLILDNWREKAGDNASSDPTINWREGQAPSTVNNSARAMMSRLWSFANKLKDWGNSIEDKIYNVENFSKNTIMTYVTSVNVDDNGITYYVNLDPAVNDVIKNNPDYLKNVWVVNVDYGDLPYHSEVARLADKLITVRHVFNIPGLENKPIRTLFNRVSKFTGTGFVDNAWYEDIFKLKGSTVEYRLYYNNRDDVHMQKAQSDYITKTRPVTITEVNNGARLTYWYDDQKLLHLQIFVNNPDNRIIDYREQFSYRINWYWFKLPNNFGNSHIISGFSTDSFYVGEEGFTKAQIGQINRFKSDGLMYAVFLITESSNGVHEFIVSDYPDRDIDFPYTLN